MTPTKNVVLDNDDDPVERMLKKTGCLELHYKVQECIASTQDWRKCQTEVQEFRDCIARSKANDNKT
ncbi:uncharacterized protein LOC143913735 [Arctopsyche grandis]|uniref:uncharacterized protein LOC143913735 n=1 Tax=Arctopsyche grandis TaxID=121162 RepID=UPI00406D878F